MKARIKGVNPLTKQLEIGFIQKLEEVENGFDPMEWMRSPSMRKKVEGLVHVTFRSRMVNGSLKRCSHQMLLSDLEPCTFPYQIVNH